MDIGILDESGRLIRFPAIEKGVRFPDEPMEIIGYRQMALESREPVVRTR